MASSEHHFRTLALMAGFGAAGALGCESVMEEEKHLPELSSDHEIGSGHDSMFRRDNYDWREITVTEEY